MTVSLQSASSGDLLSRAPETCFLAVAEPLPAGVCAAAGKSSTKANATNTPTHRIEDPTNAKIRTRP